MIQAVILNFEQVDQEEFKTKAHVKEFSDETTLKEIEEWIGTSFHLKDISNVYFTKK